MPEGSSCDDQGDQSMLPPHRTTRKRRLLSEQAFVGNNTVITEYDRSKVEASTNKMKTLVTGR